MDEERSNIVPPGPSRIGVEMSKQQYRNCTINGTQGVWEEEDVMDLLKTLGHDLMCYRAWYSPISKCIGNFYFLRNNATYISRHSK